MDDLHNKLSQVKDQHAAQIVEQRQAESEEASRDEANFILGRIWQNEHVAEAIYNNLSSQTILALERFQVEKKYRALGFETFDEFLDKSPKSRISKARYYERRALIRDHGPEIYDLLTSVGISIRAQKLLGKGDLAIRGDRLVVGDQEVEVANTGVIKEVLEELFDERRKLAADLEKLETKNQKLADQVDQGQQDYDELQRAFDAQRQGDPHERLLTRAIANLLELTEVVGQMADARRAQVAADAMPVLWAAVQRVRKAYKINFVFTEPTESEESLLDSLAAEALAGGEDLD